MLDAVSGAVPAPMEALVRMTARTMATEGVIVTLPEPAPASDSVVSVTLWVAVMVSAPAPVSGGPRVGSATGLMPAYTTCVGRLRAMAAPMPTVPSPDWVALADALSVLFEPAVMLTAPRSDDRDAGSGSAAGERRVRAVGVEHRARRLVDDVEGEGRRDPERAARVATRPLRRSPRGCACRRPSSRARDREAAGLSDAPMPTPARVVIVHLVDRDRGADADGARVRRGALRGGRGIRVVRGDEAMPCPAS